MNKLFVAFAMFAAVFTGSAFAAKDNGPPRMVEFRAICNTKALQERQERAIERTNQASYFADVAADAKEDANKQNPAYKFATGLKATIRVDGLKKDTNFAQREFNVLNHKNDVIGKVTPNAGGSGWVEFKNFDLQNGRVSISLKLDNQSLVDRNTATPFVTVTPDGWQGAGVTWQSPQFRMNYAHRMDNSAVMPELRVIGGSCVSDVVATAKKP